MHVDPALRAFASDGRAQAAVQDRVLAAREAWKARPEVAGVLADCVRLGEGAGFDDCEAHADLLTLDRARKFAAGWFAAMAEAWREVRLAQMPFRHSYSGGAGVLHLHREAGVTLALLLGEPRAAATPQTIAFNDCERREIVLAGAGNAAVYEWRDGSQPETARLALEPGILFCGDYSRSRAIVALDAPLVLLRVSRDSDRPRPMREVEIATGRVVHRASGTAADGRAELCAALLGAMARSDAAPMLAVFARGAAGEGARWQALRNALALDTGIGFRALCDIAACSGDPIRRDAMALRDRLSTTYPQLANWPANPCPAR